MALIVQKFGGTSVADIGRIRNVAAKVKRELEAGNQVVVTVSAMAGVTNQLVSLVNEASPLVTPQADAEYDSIVASGEQVTAGFKAMAEMINLSRTYNAVASLALIRRAVLEALAYGAERRAFGERLWDLPLWRATVADLVEELKAREERYAVAFADVTALRVALDQELSDFSAPLAGVREVAFFPPMTGG